MDDYGTHKDTARLQQLSAQFSPLHDVHNLVEAYALELLAALGDKLGMPGAFERRLSEMGVHFSAVGAGKSEIDEFAVTYAHSLLADTEQLGRVLVYIGEHMLLRNLPVLERMMEHAVTLLDRMDFLLEGEQTHDRNKQHILKGIVRNKLEELQEMGFTATVQEAGEDGPTQAGYSLFDR